jgi:hypothetical protein
MSNRILGVFAILFALLALGASIVVPFWVLNGAAEHIANLQVPLLAISGFLGVFACVALLVLAFKAMGLEDRTQALGMPEGSVRALIAIFLIATLGMAALFLLGPQRFGQPEKSQAQGPARPGKDQPNAHASSSVAADLGYRTAALTKPPTSPAQPATGTEPGLGTGAGPGAKGQETGGAGAGNDTGNDKGQDGTAANQTGGDLAKQFLTLVGALVTTVVGFYFGSQTASSAAARGAKAALDNRQ